MTVTVMVAYRVLFAVYFLASVSTGANVDERPPCSENAFIDITGETTNSLGLANKSGDGFTPQTARIVDGKRLSHTCSLKTCLSLCCPFGKARTEGSCVDDNVNSRILPNITSIFDETIYRRSEVNFHTFTEDPCAIGWMTAQILKTFHVLVNGSIRSRDFDGGSLSDLDQYCLFREPGSSIYFAKVCRISSWAEYDIFCLIVASLVLTTVFVCYTLIPELRNLYGLVFRSYIITYIGTYVCTLGAKFTIGSKSNAQFYSISVFIGHFAAISCAFWLNVICFDIWRKFRNLRPIESVKKGRKMKKFICYGIYAWVTPAILVASCAAIMKYVPYFRNDTYGEIFKQWTTCGVISAIFVSNGFMYASTALAINQKKKDTAHLVNGVNNHCDANEQWFNMHLKLFVIMGGHAIMWVLWVVWSIPVMMRLLLTMEVVQSFLTFYIFLCTIHVKPSIHKRFRQSLRSLNRSQTSRKPATTTTQM